MPLLQLKQITLRYSAAPLLDQADLQIDPGERICLVGRNGAGKTSLLRLITGEETPQEGEFARAPGLTISRLPQEVPADISGPVHDVIRAGLRLAGTEEEWQADIRMEELMAEMGLPSEPEFASLSGGMKRRVLLGPRAGRVTRHPAARRADQPPRPRLHPVAGAVSPPRQADAFLHHPRPHFSAPARHADRGTRPAAS